MLKYFPFPSDDEPIMKFESPYKAVLSCTEHHYYDFPIPLVVWSWNKIDFDVILFVPKNRGERLNFVLSKLPPSTIISEFDIEKEKEVTAAQVIRLYAGALDLRGYNYVLTGDADGVVFSDYFFTHDHKAINCIGADMIDQKVEPQFPMMYIGMPVKTWRQVMGINGKTPNDYIHEILDPIKDSNVRGNFWFLDQETIYKRIIASGIPYNRINRTNGKNYFATRRADRDGWNPYQKDLIDSHLPRPGYESDNFKKILELFQFQYPQEDFSWMIEYRNEYVKFKLP